jgi:hypothetical protein
VTKIKGEAERAFQVAVIPTAWPQPHVTLPALKPKYLQCLQLVKASSSKRTHQRMGSMRDIRAQKAKGVSGEPWASHIFWRRLRGKGVFWKI